MAFAPLSFQESPPYRPEEDRNFFAVPDTELSVWDTLSFITPPLTPVDISSHDKEIINHLSGQESRATTEQLHHEQLIHSRDLCRGTSPAILNDIMWNSGQKHKRPDSAMDIDVRFNLNGTPLSFDQPITNTFVDSSELFSFSLLENSCESNQAEKDCIGSQEASDSEEEIDVVSVQPESKSKKKTPQQIETYRNISKPKITLQKITKKEDNLTSDSEGEVTRISHNDLERKRRNELRNRFNNLRESIPSISNNEKAAKITILRKAYEMIPILQKEEKKLMAEKEFQRKRHTELLKRLSKLNSFR